MDKRGGQFVLSTLPPPFYQPLPPLPISAHHRVSSQLLGANIANSAALPTRPWGKPFTLSPKRGKMPICYSSELEASSLYQHTGCISDFLVFREHLGRFHALFIVVVLPASDRISSLPRHNERNFQANLLPNDSRVGA